ncbi:MAG: hypothetical protein IKD69_10370 [Solobacterium sp.]|nr:hypothetical protein [Solobacterium sp.]
MIRLLKTVVTAAMAAAQIFTAQPVITKEEMPVQASLQEESYANGEYHAEYLDEDGEAIVLSITNGTITQGSYQSGGNWYTWTNALVSVSYSGSVMQFRANFAGSQYDAEITSVYSPYNNISYVVSSSLSIPRSYTNNSTPARAVYSLTTSQYLWQLVLSVPKGSFNPTAYLSKTALS